MIVIGNTIIAHLVSLEIFVLVAPLFSLDNVIEEAYKS